MTPPSKKSTASSPKAATKKTKATSKAKSGKKSAEKAAGEGTGDKKRPISPPEMSQELIDFITAIDSYKRVNQRPFPSWGEVLEVLKSLGYERP